MDPSDFYDLVSGRKRGVLAAGARGLLRLAEVPYSLAVRWRNGRYEAGKKEVVTVGAPVISVGNLTLGGTGKTPLVKWLARHLRNCDLRVAILSRGYGAADGAKNDEALELEQVLPDVPHLQSPDRVSIAQTAVGELESQVLLLDDGFQHRRLARDLDIVLLDATQPFGYDHVFPRGTLREPAVGLARADVVCLSRANLIEPSERETLRQRAAKLSPGAVWCEVAHAPSQLLNSQGETAPLDALNGRRVLGFCGIGNPVAFRTTLESAGAEVAVWREFPDHHSYTADDVAELAALAKQHDVELVVGTHKDLVKLRTPAIGDAPLWAVVVEMEFLAGQGEFIAAVCKATQSITP